MAPSSTSDRWALMWGVYVVLAAVRVVLAGSRRAAMAASRSQHASDRGRYSRIHLFNSNLFALVRAANVRITLLTRIA